MLGPVSASGYQSPCRSSRWSSRTPFSILPADVWLELDWMATEVAVRGDSATDWLRPTLARLTSNMTSKTARQNRVIGNCPCREAWIESSVRRLYLTYR